MGSILKINNQYFLDDACGRYGFSIKDEKEVLNRFDIKTINFELKNSYNVAPTQEMPVVERHSPNSIHLREWGIQPSWSKMFLINAQAEKLSTSGLWKKAFMESRCIIPASFFYEWKKTEDGKQPYLIRLKSKEMFGFAGILVTYHNDKKEEKLGYIIITTTPNKIMEEIHNRMPVILKKENEDEWLNPDNVEPDKLMSLLEPYDDSKMDAYPISSLVNSPKNNYPEITKPID